ncbi:hypothetical protein [Streptomyces olivochromogenes]|uniref:hypothetical protein n=1 Tax=Streptomyces olivochromogenes TaxID=1963 RepID=UPI0036CBDF88
MSVTVRRTAAGHRLPDRIRALLASRGPMTVEAIAAALCAPGRDAVDRCARSLEALAGRGLAVRDGDRWRAAR